MGVSILAAPSAAPTSVSVSAVTSSSITVQWGAVDCIHRNGDITGYSVRYGEVGSAEGDRSVEMVSGDSSGGMYDISGLSAAARYTIEVAAVNSAGPGEYSGAIDQLTDSKCFLLYYVNTCSPFFQSLFSYSSSLVR